MSSFTRRDLLRSGVAVSALGLVTHPWKSLLAAESETAVSPRERLLFDFDWKFFQGHGADPGRDLGFGRDQGDFAKSGEFRFSQPSFDDSKWRVLNLPHDWAVELPFVHDEALQSHGYKPL